MSIRHAGSAVNLISHDSSDAVSEFRSENFACNPRWPAPPTLHDWLVASRPASGKRADRPNVDRAGSMLAARTSRSTGSALLGPSCVLAARRLVAWLEAEPAGFRDLAGRVGGRRSGLGSGDRAERPGRAHVEPVGRLPRCDRRRDVRDPARCSRPCARQIVRLPDHLAAAHAVDRTRRGDAAMTCRSGRSGKPTGPTRRCRTTCTVALHRHPFSSHRPPVQTQVVQTSGTDVSRLRPCTNEMEYDR